MRICVLNMVLKKTNFSQVEFCFHVDFLCGGLQCKFTSMFVLLWWEKCLLVYNTIAKFLVFRFEYLLLRSWIFDDFTMVRWGAMQAPPPPLPIFWIPIEEFSNNRVIMHLTYSKLASPSPYCPSPTSFNFRISILGKHSLKKWTLLPWWWPCPTRSVWSCESYQDKLWLLHTWG